MLYNEFKSLLDKIKTSLSCPACKAKYSEPGITILGTFQNESLIHLACEKCNAQSLITAVINRHNEIRPHKGVLHLQDSNRTAPLSRTNVSANISPITANEVIDVHNFLQTFDGNFKSLFS